LVEKEMGKRKKEGKKNTTKNYKSQKVLQRHKKRTITLGHHNKKLTIAEKI